MNPSKVKRHISVFDIRSIVRSLDKWGSGELGAELTWAKIAEESGFSRQSLNANPEIKAAYLVAKQALKLGGLAKSRVEAVSRNEDLEVENDRLRTELEFYKKREDDWLARWQRIAYHIRAQGKQVVHVDRIIPEGVVVPSATEANKILKPFDKDIPSSGRK